MEPHPETAAQAALATATEAGSTPPDSPCVHVVTACFNSASTIAATIESVLGQEGLGQYVVVDGASTDKTLSIVQQAEAHAGGRMTVISEPDAGIYDAMNKGIRLLVSAIAPDDLIATLNSDDAYLPHALAMVIELARAHPEADIIFGDVELMDEAGEPTGMMRRSAPQLTKASAQDGMPVEHAATFVRARLYREIGLYDTGYPIAADYEFILRALDAEATALHLPEILTRFRHGGVSTADELPSYKDAIRARIAHGSPPVGEWARYYKRRMNARAFALVKWVPGMERLQARHGASTKGVTGKPVAKS